MNNLHAENDDKGSECPSRIDQCLGRSNSRSTGWESVIATINPYKNEHDQ